MRLKKDGKKNNNNNNNSNNQRRQHTIFWMAFRKVLFCYNHRNCYELDGFLKPNTLLSLHILGRGTEKLLKSFKT